MEIKKGMKAISANAHNGDAWIATIHNAVENIAPSSAATAHNVRRFNTKRAQSNGLNDDNDSDRVVKVL